MALTSRRNLLLATALLVFGAEPASADLIAYASTSQGDFGTIDLNTGVYSSIGSTGLSPGTAIFGMGFIGSTLYGVDNNTPGAGFYSINTATGAATQIATLTQSAVGGTSIDGTFYGVTQDAASNLFGVDTAGGLLGTKSLGFQGDGLVAADSSGQNLYISEYTGNVSSGDELFSVNISGSVTDVGGLNDGMGNGQVAIAGLIDGSTLYTTDGDNIYTYTLGSFGVSVLVSTTPITGLNPDGEQLVGLAANATAVPPPPSFILLAFGALSVRFFNLRRRTIAG
jgi:hypothetical protein